MKVESVEFGYYPRELNFGAGSLAVETLPDLDAKVSALESEGAVHESWVYAPPQQSRDFFKRVTVQRPYASRIFGLPMTHILSYRGGSAPGHLNFLVWCLGFFAGMRLTSSERGFLDATPIKPNSLTDFVLNPGELAQALDRAEIAWQQHHLSHRFAKRIEGIIHALFLSCYPLYLEFEKFTYLYTALDACYALAKDLRGGSAQNHARRVAWMCQEFGMPIPVWAQANGKQSEVSLVRNDALHEALFFDEPLGFSVYRGASRNGSVPLEMRALICRLLVAFLGGAQFPYVKTPVNTRQSFSLDF